MEGTGCLYLEVQVQFGTFLFKKLAKGASDQTLETEA